MFRDVHLSKSPLFTGRKLIWHRVVPSASFSRAIISPYTWRDVIWYQMLLKSEENKEIWTQMIILHGTYRIKELIKQRALFVVAKHNDNNFTEIIPHSMFNFSSYTFNCLNLISHILNKILKLVPTISLLLTFPQKKRVY